MKKKVLVELNITNETIDDIMVSAFEGGITYWCHQADVVGKYLGEYASEQISRDGTLKLYTPEGEMLLTKDKFICGLMKYVQKHPKVIADGGIDTAMIDAPAADCIIQYALFGKLIYG